MRLLLLAIVFLCSSRTEALLLLLRVWFVSVATKVCACVLCVCGVNKQQEKMGGEKSRNTTNGMNEDSQAATTHSGFKQEPGF